MGFSYRDDEESYGPTYNSRRKKPARHYRPAKDYSVLSAFKFIVKESHEEFPLQLYDPNENVEWRDVV